MKTILFMMLMASVASAETRTYDIKPLREVLKSRHNPCGAVARMLKDKHVLKISDDGTVRINGKKWTVLHDEPDLVLEFHTENRSVVYLEMDLYVNMRGLSGAYFIYGVDDSRKKPADREQCYDVVYVDGTAR